MAASKTAVPESSEGRAIRRENREKLVEFFRAGEHANKGGGKLGVEVEHFAVFDDGTPLAYRARNGRVGVSNLLEYLSCYYPSRQLSPEGDLLGLEGPEGSITLEPAAQVEMSIAPYTDVALVQHAYENFRGHANAYLAAHGAHLENWGYHPTSKAFDLPLIPKERYRLMNEFFVGHVGDHGERMMRGSASTQVSVDYSDEGDAVRKLRLASALAPILAAIADNTPVFEGAPNHLPIRHLDIWRHVSPAHCGVIPGVFDEGFGYGAYADWLLAQPPILVTRPAASDPQGPSTRAAFDTAAADAYDDAPMDEGDVAHLASMVWPDARLKHVVEIRPADCMEAPQVMGYAALVKGLFYAERSRSSVEDMLGVRGSHWPLAEKDVEDACLAIEHYGMDALVYDVPLREWESELFSLARQALGATERDFLLPLEDFATQKPWWHAE